MRRLALDSQEHEPMRALTWHGKHDVRVDTVPDPEIVNPRDAIIKITSTAICGSDLHLYDHTIPTMKAGDVLGHEFMGEVMEVGPGNKKLKVGQRVVVPFVIACGQCFFCKQQQFAACDNSNPAETADMSEFLYGYPMTGAFGYSHLTGGYAGGQAEYVRVPYSDIGPIVVPDGVEDEKVLFLSDILPTGWMAAVNCEIKPEETVAVWGCGPVVLFAVQSAFALGAHRVIAIDHYPHRLDLAKSMGAEVINFEEVDVREALVEMTGGIGPDACIDAVGMESHGFTADSVLDKVKAAVKLVTDQTHGLRQVIIACRKGGRISIPGVYGGVTDKFPIGALMEKGLSIKSGQTHVQKYMPQLLEMIMEGKLNTTFLISHRLSLEEAPQGYKMFKERQNEVTKVVLKPGDARASNDEVAEARDETVALATA
jgi:threonine dehydrogenase-like Zn-dependent dehydrogenase